MRKPANHFQNMPSYQGFKGSAGTVHCQKPNVQRLNTVKNYLHKVSAVTVHCQQLSTQIALTKT